MHCRLQVKAGAALAVLVLKLRVKGVLGANAIYRHKQTQGGWGGLLGLLRLLCFRRLLRHLLLLRLRPCRRHRHLLLLL